MTVVAGQAGVPDILEVIADLSNDEVFTPPQVARDVLDLLPDEVWSDSSLRWLDPGVKTGVFLREITRRLMVGLEPEFPDPQERLSHILRNQVFGVAITGLTALMSRRTLYCSKDAAGDASAVEMGSPDGNIWFQRIEHDYEKGRCKACGASAAQLERGEARENYAYGFIHEKGLESIEEAFGMKFDVIVGNPPYQMDDEGGHRPVPIYNKFVETAFSLNPRFVAMITPSRWMAGGLGLSPYRARILGDNRIRDLVDFPVASEIFGGVEIKGGVSYFLWDSEWEGLCKTTLIRGDEVVGPVERSLGDYDVFVRDPRALGILSKVLEKDESSFSELVASVRPFGDQLRSNFRGGTDERGAQTDLVLHMKRKEGRWTGWVSEDYVRNNLELSRSWKVFLPTAASDGGQKLPDTVIGKGFVGEPRSVCTETFLAIGPLTSEDAAASLLSYLQCRFSRFLISLRKPGQHNIPSTFKWLPQQSWDRTWTDEELYEKYGITKEEQTYIAEMIKEMPA